MKRLLLLSLLLAAWVLSPAGELRASSDPATRILYLGDSLSIGAFGRTFDRDLRSSGLEVYTVVAGGASPYYWLGNYQSLPCTIGFWEKSPSSERRVGYVRAVPKIESLIGSHDPDVVVVQTGINLYATLRSKRRSKEENVAEVTSLIEQMCHAIATGGAQSYWVLPPHSHEERYSEALQDELAGIMRSVVRRYEGRVFESSEVTTFDDPYPATDGIHYGPTEARAWAKKVSSHFLDYVKVSPKADTSRIVRALPIQTPKASSKRSSLARSSGGAVGSQKEEVSLLLRLLEKSELQNLADLDYSNALGVYEYQVIEDRMGNYPYDRIRVAHGIVFGRKYSRAAEREIGSRIAMDLVPLSTYKTLSTWQMVDDLRMNLELPIYTPKLD